MLPDDIGPVELWEALRSNPAALRAVHTADMPMEQPQELLSVLEDVQSQRKLGRMSLC